ncbi:HTH_48 domain-containing protein [Trichonephila clavipes]|nr:HTH_48 domain-containing protein [Trichonephila clavipes]
MFLAGHPSQGCFGLQSHCAPCYFFNQASFYPSDFSFTVLRGRNSMECHRELVEALGTNALPYGTVTGWVGKFQQRRMSTSDEQHGVANTDTDGIQRFPHRCGDSSRRLH